MKKHIYLSLLFVACTALFTPLKACQDTVLFTPQYSFEGDLLIVELYQNQKNRFLSLQVGIAYDPAVLSFNNINVSTPSTAIGESSWNNLPGRLLLILSSNDGFPQPIDLSKPLITMKFNILKSQSTSYFIKDPNMAGEFAADINSASCIKFVNNQIDLTFGTIAGKVLLDTEDDCLANSGARILENWKLIFDNGNNTFVRTTKADGSYHAGLPVGTYSVSLIPKNDLYSICSAPVTLTLQKDQMITGINFTTKPIKSCAILQTNINAAFFRRCFDNSVRIRYENIGTISAENASVSVLLDDYMTLITASLPYTLEGDTLVFKLGNISPDDPGFIDIVVNIDCQNTEIGQTHCIMALGYPNEPCLIPSVYAGSEVVVNGICDNDDKVVFTLTNIGLGNMPTPIEYIVVEDDVMRPPVTYQLNANESLVLDLDADGKTYSLITRNEINFPGLSRPRAFVEGCGRGNTSTGFVNLLPLDDFDPFVDILCMQNIGAYDPNDITGFPAGYGDKKYIEKYDKIEYKIRFQNTGTDTAFNIVIRNMIEDHLDINTFKMTVASHDYSFQFEKDKELVVTFKDIQLVDSFKNEALSHGYLVYEIYPSDVLVDEDRIENRAEIYFDFNTPIQTNIEKHTIGRPLFVSSVISLDPKIMITAYPNPTSEKLIINLDRALNFSYTVFDNSGKILQSDVYDKQQGIDCGSFGPGIFIVRITDQSKTLATIKFIKN